MASLADFFRNLFKRPSGEDRVAAYIVREHDRGRTVNEILQDPYVKNRATGPQVARIMERPEVIHALGEATSHVES